MSFLTANWRKLSIANYEVDPSLLIKYIPAGTTLDLYKGKCYLSLVGFLFEKTRICGIPIPFHGTFEEVNLRFYVKRKVNNEWRRGVVFIKEIVPKFAVTFIANSLYHENYQTMPMRHTWVEQDDVWAIHYKWKNKEHWNTFKVIAKNEQKEVDENSLEEFITEHYWGYARINANQSNEYEVKHPKWTQYVVEQYEIEVDFEKLYGNRFAHLSKLKPSSVLLAEGSKISVETKNTISR